MEKFVLKKYKVNPRAVFCEKKHKLKILCVIFR